MPPMPPGPAAMRDRPRRAPRGHRGTCPRVEDEGPAWGEMLLPNSGAPARGGSARDLGRLLARQHQQVLIGQVFRGLDAKPRRQRFGLYDAPRDAWALRR